MKKLAVISLIVMFLTGQHAFASCPYESLSQTNEAQELTQEEMEELVINLLSSIDREELEQIAVSAINQNEIDLDTLMEQIPEIQVNLGGLCAAFFIVAILRWSNIGYWILAIVFCSLA